MWMKDYKDFIKDIYPDLSKKYFRELSFGLFMKAQKINPIKYEII
jgi:hypothetical protein